MPILGIMASAISGNLSSYESIATTTAGSGGVASVTFSSIPATYSHLQIRSIAKMTSTAASGDDQYIIQVNGDTSANYSWHMMYGIGTNPSAFATGGSAQTRMGPYGLPYAANVGFGAMITDVLDYANTNKNKTFRFLAGYDNNGNGDMLLASGARYSTTAITSITFTPSGGNFAEYSSFALYGVRG